MIITLALSIALMSFLARASGGGFFKVEGFAGRIPEMLFSIPFGLCLVHETGLWALFFYGALSSYYAMETGHGTAYFMGLRPEEAQSGRKQFLSHIVDPICRLFKQPLGGVFYCWLFMGIKGLWIGLPLGWWALLLAVLWPSMYRLGWWLWFKGSRYAWDEILSGAAAGLVVGLSLF